MVSLSPCIVQMRQPCKEVTSPTHINHACASRSCSSPSRASLGMHTAEVIHNGLVFWVPDILAISPGTNSVQNLLASLHMVARLKFPSHSKPCGKILIWAEQKPNPSSLLMGRVDNCGPLQLMWWAQTNSPTRQTSTAAAGARWSPQSTAASTPHPRP